jgi:hypothetical protein
VPFMAAGAFICLLFGDPIVNWYLKFYGLGSPPAVTRPEEIQVLPNGQVRLPSDARIRQPRPERNQPEGESHRSHLTASGENRRLAKDS